MSSKELDIGPNQLVITKSDPAGKITYCNQSFFELSGYTEQELIGQPHNIFRHPDMPSGLFYLLWQTLGQKKEFNGFIKNITKSGDSYWAFTNITPVYSATGQLTGYTCAKRQANSAAETLFSMYYEQMADEEQGQKNDASAKRSLQLLIDMLSATGDSYEASVFKLQFS
jgi:PAS domain S-box-containing protein